MKSIDINQMTIVVGGLTKVQCDAASGFLGGLGIGMSLTGVGGPLGMLVAGVGLGLSIACA